MKTSLAPTTPKASVLVVDDEPVLLKSIVRALDQAGFAVERAQDGTAALARIASARFDAIVSDISMPGMTGVQLLHRVREVDLDVPVILMTGTPSTETAIRAIELGALRYLVKPFEIAALVDAVAQAARLHAIARLKRQALEVVGTYDRQLGDRAALGGALDRALASLRAVYQPIVSWPARTTHAYEALMRTDEPTLPHPGAVLEAAERLGRLREIGRKMRARVAAEVADAPSPLVFVNLHTLDLLDDELYGASAPLSRHARRIVLEITERAALDDVKDIGARIAALRTLGFRIAIDDLGAGYAGLTSFAQLEPNVVKFDMSLIRGLDAHPLKRKLVGSMTTLFHELGLEVIAEGVETTAERDALSALGCTLLQGYLFARPATPFPPPVW